VYAPRAPAGPGVDVRRGSSRTRRHGTGGADAARWGHLPRRAPARVAFASHSLSSPARRRCGRLRDPAFVPLVKRASRFDVHETRREVSTPADAHATIFRLELLREAGARGWEAALGSHEGRAGSSRAHRSIMHSTSLGSSSPPELVPMTPKLADCPVPRVPLKETLVAVTSAPRWTTLALKNWATRSSPR
jgi:hypothetical protein